MMGIGFPELMIILVIIMIIFGAGKLPEIGSAFGRSIKNFKSSMKEAEELEKAVETPEGGTPEGEIAEGGEGAQSAQSEMDKAQEEEKALSDEEKEKLAREKAQAEGEAKDKAMKDTSDRFTANLPRKGSYDYAEDMKQQEAKKKKKV